jgi:hypothetical protein
VLKLESGLSAHGVAVAAATPITASTTVRGGGGGGSGGVNTSRDLRKGAVAILGGRTN